MSGFGINICKISFLKNTKCFNELLLRSKLIKNLNLSQRVSSLHDSVRNETNPLAHKLPMKSKNIFVDVLRFRLCVFASN